MKALGDSLSVGEIKLPENQAKTLGGIFICVPSSKKARNHCLPTSFTLWVKLMEINLMHFFKDGTKMKILSEVKPLLKYYQQRCAQ